MRLNGSQPGEVNFLIPISNGLLRADHRKRIGIALWEFEWLVDRTTVEEDGWGKVLGGKPISYSQIAKDLGVSERTVAANCRRLAREGYVRLDWTRQGNLISVAKSKKFIRKSQEGTFRGARKDSSSQPGRKLLGSQEESFHPYKEDLKGDNKRDRGNPSLEEWKALGTRTPTGNKDFRQTWKIIYSNRNGETISEVMEKAIGHCNQKNISIPGHFYSLKRNVEHREREADTGNPRGLDLPKIEAWQ